MTPLVSIRNLGPEKCQEGVRRELIILNGLKKTKSQTWGRNGVTKNRVKELLGLSFFQITKNYENYERIFFTKYYVAHPLVCLPTQNPRKDNKTVSSVPVSQCPSVPVSQCPSVQCQLYSAKTEVKPV